MFFLNPVQIIPVISIHSVTPQNSRGGSILLKMLEYVSPVIGWSFSVCQPALEPRTNEEIKILLFLSFPGSFAGGE
jgi:hypothetical protein